MTEQLAAPRSRPPGSYTHRQALDDAIRYRTARLTATCRKCRSGALCHDHACDLSLLAAYRRMAQTAVAELERSRQARRPVITRRAG